MGDDARSEAIARITSKLMIHFESWGAIESHEDVKFWLNVADGVAEFIYQRELAYQALLSAMLSGDFILFRTLKEPHIEIPNGAILRCKVPIKIEEQPDKNVLIIRRET